MIKSQVELLADLRERVGRPEVNAVSDRPLKHHLKAALEWLADRLQFNVQNETLDLSADTQTYDLPSDLLLLLNVAWHGADLDMASVAEWRAKRRPYPDATPGQPREYAVLGRQLILNPAADSSAIDTDSALSWSWVRSAPELTAAGVQGLTNPDLDAAVLYAAINFIAAKTPKDEAEAAADARRLQIYQPLLQDRMQRIEERVRGSVLRDYQPRLTVKTNRWPAAR